MNLSQMNHALQWWDRNGRMDDKLLEKVLNAKAGIKDPLPLPKKVSKLQSLFTRLRS
jgi:hypothetical protein